MFYGTGMSILISKAVIPCFIPCQVWTPSSVPLCLYAVAGSYQEGIGVWLLVCATLCHPASSVWCQASHATTLCVCQWLLHINHVPVTLASAAKLQITWRGSRGRDREGERGGLFDYMWNKMCMRMERAKEREIRNVSPRASEQQGRRNK